MKSPTIQLRLCPECDASNEAAAASCWLCQHRFGKADEVIQAEIVPEARDSVIETLFAVLTVFTAGLSLLMILGAWKTAPGLAIVVALCVVPAFVATIVRTLGRQARGLPFRWQTTFSTFFLSVTAGLLILCMLAVGLVIALIAVCFAAMYSLA